MNVDTLYVKNVWKSPIKLKKIKYLLPGATLLDFWTICWQLHHWEICRLYQRVYSTDLSELDYWNKQESQKWCRLIHSLIHTTTKLYWLSHSSSLCHQRTKLQYPSLAWLYCCAFSTACAKIYWLQNLFQQECGQILKKLTSAKSKVQSWKYQ